MKHIYLSLVLLFLSCAVFGQETMLGLTRIQNYGSGGVFRITPGEDSFESRLLFSVPLSEGVGKLLEHSNGRVYGVTCRGGFWNKGVLYSMDEFGQDFTLEYHFGQDNDFIPRAGVTEGDGGAILGIKGEEETKGIGEVYQFDPKSSTLFVIRQFTLMEASGTVSPLLIASDGKIYGTSPYGGNAGKGNIFRLNQDGSGFEKLYEFGQSDLHVPAPEVIEHVNGKIYGVVHYYGPNSGNLTSRLLRLNKDGSDFEFLGSLPERHIISGKIFTDAKGNLYGVFPERGPFLGGGVFKTDSLGKRFQALHHFDYKEEDGRQYPSGGLILGRDGLLYGICAGKVYPNSDGAAFRINRYGNDFEWIQSFDYYHGNKPKEGLIQTSSGHFWGTTTRGGLGDDGVVFGFEAEDDTVTVHKQLGTASIGSFADGRLLQVSGDRLIGATYAGGEFGYGMIFSSDICGRNIEIIHSFDAFQKMAYRMKLMEGMDGKIYGVTYGSRWTFLFSMNRDGTDWSILYNFDGEVYSVSRNLIQTFDEKIYGISYSDNFNGTHGRIFSVNKSGTDYLQEYIFDQSSEITYVSGDLMQHSNGKLYGTHQSGVFSFDRNSRTTEIFQLSFYEDPDFDMIGSPLWEGENGRLYGTGIYSWVLGTSQQKLSQGFLYSIQPDGTDFQEHFLFKNSEGIYPSGGVTGNTNGQLYFCSTNTRQIWTESESYFGAIYTFDPIDAKIEIVQFFNGNQDLVPHGSPIFVQDSCIAPAKESEPGMNPQDSTIRPLTIFPNPTSEIFEVHSGIEETGEVVLRDLQGRLLLTQALDPQTGSTSINMRTFPSGTYLITISTSETTTTHKVVKW